MSTAKIQVNEILSTIDAGSVHRVYRGRVGCMCGCKGTYREGGRAAKRAIGDFRQAAELGENIEVFDCSDGSKGLYLERGERVVAVYFGGAAAGV